MKTFINRSLLPLNALRAFEVSARHLSFTKAAKELNVTQGAVSRQVKQLEIQLGAVLFHRLHRSLRLTRQGQALFHPLTHAFDTLSDAINNFKNQTKDLCLKVHPTFAIRWLIPRLHKFQAQYPDIQVRFTTSNINVDFASENFDIAVTFRGSDISGVIREKILEEQLTPVCSPNLLKGDPPLKTLSDLRYHRLLHNSPDQQEWRAWARQAGVEGLSYEKGQTFEIDDAALQAAVAGLGIALGDRLLVREDIVSGRLAEPFDYIKVKTGDYFLCRLQANRDNPGVVEFGNWLKKEINSD